MKLRHLQKFVMMNCKDAFKYIMMPINFRDHFVLCILEWVLGEISKALYLDPLEHSDKVTLDYTIGYVEIITGIIQDSHGKEKELQFNRMPKFELLEICIPSPLSFQSSLCQSSLLK